MRNISPQTVKLHEYMCTFNQQELFFVPPCATVGYLYVTCLIQNCSDKMLTAQFLGKIDHNSLLVQDDYIFVKVNTSTTGYVTDIISFFCETNT